MARHLEVAQFDKRGIGLSDRPEEMPTLEQRIGDIRAILDELEWPSASLLGVSEGGIMAQLFAAEFPERVDRVVLHNTAAPARYRRALGAHVRPEDPPLLDLSAEFEAIVEGWPENTQQMVDWFMPDKSDDEAFVRWAGRFQRLSASPRDFARQVESVLVLDAGDAPERIQAPTLVQHVNRDRVLHVALGRLLAQVVPGAEYQEIDGDSHFSWVLPNWREMCDPMIQFVTDAAPEHVVSRRFATVLFTDIVDSTRQSAAVGDAAWHELIDRHDRMGRRLVAEHGGRVVKSTGDGMLVVFDAPSQGVGCGADLVRELGEMGLAIRAGVHAGEIEVHEDLDISGIAVNLAARVEQAATDGELWASSTVRDMMLGGSASFDERGEHTLKGIDGTWRLFAVGLT
jgi:class 3 adenylate cyclase